MSARERRAIGARIRELRLEQGVSQKQLAAVIGVDPSMLSRVEKGTRELSATQLTRASEALSVPTEDLARGTQSPTTWAETRMRLVTALWEATSQIRGVLPAEDAPYLLLPTAFLKLANDLYPAEAAKEASSYLVIPEEARWHIVRASAEPLGALSGAWDALEQRNARQLAGAFTEARRAATAVPPTVLRQVVGTVDQLDFAGDDDHATAGTRFQALIDALTITQGKRGGEYSTPASLISLIGMTLAERTGPVFDPAAGTGGLLAACASDDAGHQNAAFGQELNTATGQLALLNLAAHETTGEVASGDSLQSDAFPNLKATTVVCNPPFGQRSTPGQLDLYGLLDPRWRYGAPSASDLSYAWLQHCLAHLAPDGQAAIVLATGPLFRAQGNDAAIRASLVRDQQLTAVVLLPPQLFSSTGIQSALWLLDRQARRDEFLMIDASRLGERESRGHVVLPEEHITLIARTYKAWLSDSPDYAETPAFNASVTLGKLEESGFQLVPTRYVGNPEQGPEATPPGERIERLRVQLADDFAQTRRLTEAVQRVLDEVHE